MPVNDPNKQINIIKPIILVGVIFFFPNNQYTNIVTATGNKAGIILSKIPFCNDKITLPVLNLRGINTFTTVGIRHPITINPIIEIASVKMFIFFHNDVTNLVPELYPVLNNHTFKK